MGKGSIQLILDKPYYIAGEVVTGNCQLVLTENVITKDLTIKWKVSDCAFYLIIIIINPKTTSFTPSFIIREWKEQNLSFKEL